MNYKKLFFLLLSLTLLNTNNTYTHQHNMLSPLQKAAFTVCVSSLLVALAPLYSTKKKSFKIAEIALWIAKLSLCVVFLDLIHTISIDARPFFFPNEAEKARALEGSERSHFLKTQRDLRNCLIKESKSERSDSGRPAACEQIAKMLALAGGNLELEKLTQIFITHFKQ